MADKLYLGLDVGKKGALVGVHQSKIVYKAKMPLVADEDVDVIRLRDILFELSNVYQIHVVMEKFAGFFGYSKSGAVSVARQSGFVESMLMLTETSHTRIAPQSWQKLMFEGTKVLKDKDGKRQTKKMALLTTSRLFPGEKFLATERSSTPHDGMVDGALLALYGERKAL